MKDHISNRLMLTAKLAVLGVLAGVLAFVSGCAGGSAKETTAAVSAAAPAASATAAVAASAAPAVSATTADAATAAPTASAAASTATAAATTKAPAPTTAPTASAAAPASTKAAESPKATATAAPASTPAAKELKVQVEARSWEWKLDQTEVPAGTPIHFVVKDVDGAHGFSIVGTNINVPMEEGDTKDVMWTPDKPGVYTIKCSLFCGTGHTGMETKLTVK